MFKKETHRLVECTGQVLVVIFYTKTSSMNCTHLHVNLWHFALCIHAQNRFMFSIGHFFSSKNSHFQSKAKCKNLCCENEF